MISRASYEESAFRHTARGREPVHRAADSQNHIHYTPRQQRGIGSITSRPRPPVTFFEQLAFELGVNVATARKLWDQGLVK